jgi:pyruvate/2-oxoglutarate dehydrogenase complex dihydrolipoamide dehydrogenase (E3) component
MPSKFIVLLYIHSDNRTSTTTKMKLICVGTDEKVVELHGIGYGMDEILQGFAVALKWEQLKRLR